MAKQKKKKKQVSKGGRPSPYDNDRFPNMVRGLAMLGLTDEAMADFFSIATSTFYLWCKKHKEFSESLKKGRLLADIEVVSSMYKRATGMTITEQKVASTKDDWEVVDLKKELPPDVGAGAFWLKNKHPGVFAEKKDKEDSNIEINVKFDE